MLRATSIDLLAALFYHEGLFASCDLKFTKALAQTLELECVKHEALSPQQHEAAVAGREAGGAPCPCFFMQRNWGVPPKLGIPSEGLAIQDYDYSFWGAVLVSPVILEATISSSTEDYGRVQVQGSAG